MSGPGPSWLRRSFEALSGRKVFRAAAAYFFGAWLLTEVSATVLPLFGAPESVVRVIVIALVALFPFAMIFAWAFDVGADGIKRTRDVVPTTGGTRKLDFAIIVVLLAVIGYLVIERFTGSDHSLAPTAAAQHPAPSIAVLPFDNFSTDSDNEVFGDGLAEELLNRLARIDGLQVAARTSAFKFKDTQAGIREIGEALNVATLLEGSVQAAGDRIRVTAQLVDVSSGRYLWSESFNRELTDVFAIQEEIAQLVAQSLRVQLLGEDETAADPERPTDDLDAYRLYLRGRSEWHKRTSASLEKAVALFREAIELDPQFAAAWSGLADAYNFLGSYGNLAMNEAVEKSEQAARKALELDPDLAEAHASLGLVYLDQMRFEQAASQFERAVELNPNFAMARTWFGSSVSWLDPERGLEQHRIAAELDPLSPMANQALGNSLFKLGRDDEAREQYLRIVEFAPEFPLVYFELANLAISRHDYRQAVEYLLEANELDPGRAATLAVLGSVYLTLGDIEAAHRWVGEAEALGPDQLTVHTARLTLLYTSGDWDGVEAYLAENLSRPQDVFLATTYRGSVAYAQGEYERAARIFQGVFDDIASRQATPTEGFVVADETMIGLLYLASSLARSGQTDRASEIARDLIVFLDRRAAAGIRRSQYDFVRMGALVTLEDRDGALNVLRSLAEAGWPDHLRLERDRLFEPLRNEVEFELSMDYIRNNAASQLDALRQI